MTSSGPIGGNTTRSGGRVGPSAGAPKIILTKNSSKRKNKEDFFIYKQKQRRRRVKNETRRKILNFKNSDAKTELTFQKI